MRPLGASLRYCKRMRNYYAALPLVLGVRQFCSSKFQNTLLTVPLRASIGRYRLARVKDVSQSFDLHHQFGSTMSLPRIMFIPQVKVNSPVLSGVNSMGVVLKAGRSRAIRKSPKTTCSLHDAVSSR